MEQEKRDRIKELKLQRFELTKRILEMERHMKALDAELNICNRQLLELLRIKNATPSSNDRKSE